MCDFYIYKIIDNGIIALLFFMAVFYWRGAMGVGAFLNARAVDKDREALNKFNQYVTYQTKRDELIDSTAISKNNIIEKRYRKSIRTYYGIGAVNVLFLIGLLFYFDEKIIGGFLTITGYWQLMSIVFFIFLLFLLFKFSHLKRNIISNSDEGLQYMEEFLSEAKKVIRKREMQTRLKKENKNAG